MPSFHSGPSLRCLREPLMSNVRRHKSIERQLRVNLEMQQLQCNRSASERSAPRRVDLASGEIHRQPRGKLGSKCHTLRSSLGQSRGASKVAHQVRAGRPSRQLAGGSPEQRPGRTETPRTCCSGTFSSGTLFVSEKKNAKHKLTEFARVQTGFRGGTP